MNIWRRYTGLTGWPTIFLAVFVAAGVVFVWTATLSGTLSYGWGCVAMVVLGYIAFTPLHEAVHTNLGRRGQAWLNDGIGWMAAAFYGSPFPAFRAIHLRHHAVTNQAGVDPDHWVAGAAPWTVALRCLTIIPYYIALFLGRIGGKSTLLRNERRLAVVALLGYVGIAAGLTACGLGAAVWWLWVLPGVLSSALLAFAFDWVPHHPHTETARYRNTRSFLAPGLGWLMFGHHVHVVHHLFPRIPFYHYATVFYQMRDELERAGAPIVDWERSLDNPDAPGSAQ